MPEISIVIPVYNEEDNLYPLISAIFASMDSVKREYEVIFVNDGSTDNSFEILKKLACENANIKIVNFDANYGLTAAIDAGFKASSGDIIVSLDADLQNDPADIPKMLDGVKDYDMVCGWRHKRDDPLTKRVSSVIANYIRNKVSNEHVTDSACTLKAFRRQCLDKIKLYGGLHRFLPTLFKMEGFSVTEVKVNHHPRTKGKSKFNIRNRMFTSFLDLLAVAWMKKRHLDYKLKK